MPGFEAVMNCVSFCTVAHREGLEINVARG